MPGFDNAAGMVSDQLAHLRIELEACRETIRSNHVYLLLDPNCPVAPHHALHIDSLRTRTIQRACKEVLRPDFEHQPELCPRLVQLHVAGEHGWVDDALLEISMECAWERCAAVNGSYVCGWLVSEAEPLALARHVATAGVMFDLARGRTRHIPLFEPHRLALAIAHAEPTVSTSWLGPIGQWFFLNSARQLQKLERASVHDAEQQSHQRFPLAFFQAMERLRQSRFVLLALAKLDLIPLQSPELQINEAVAVANSQGLRETEDVVLHALNSLTLGPRWVQHPAALKAFDLMNSAQPPISLKNALEMLSDEELIDMECYAQATARATASDRI